MSQRARRTYIGSGEKKKLGRNKPPVATNEQTSWCTFSMYEAKIYQFFFHVLHPTPNSNRTKKYTCLLYYSRTIFVSATIQGKQRTSTGYSRTQHRLGSILVTAEIRSPASINLDSAFDSSWQTSNCKFTDPNSKLSGTLKRELYRSKKKTESE